MWTISKHMEDEWSFLISLPGYFTIIADNVLTVRAFYYHHWQCFNDLSIKFLIMVAVFIYPIIWKILTSMRGFVSALRYGFRLHIRYNNCLSSDPWFSDLRLRLKLKGDNTLNMVLFMVLKYVAKLRLCSSHEFVPQLWSFFFFWGNNYNHLPLVSGKLWIEKWKSRLFNHKNRVCPDNDRWWYNNVVSYTHCVADSCWVESCLRPKF